MSDSLCVGTKKQKDLDMLGCFGGMFHPSKDFNCENCEFLIITFGHMR